MIVSEPSCYPTAGLEVFIQKEARFVQFCPGSKSAMLLWQRMPLGKALAK